MSMECAMHISENQEMEKLSQLHHLQDNKKPTDNILINAVGFGGNAVSIIIGK